MKYAITDNTNREKKVCTDVHLEVPESKFKVSLKIRTVFITPNPRFEEAGSARIDFWER